MTKDGLIAAVQGVLGGTRAEAGRAVEAVFDTVTKSLARGEEVNVTGFGKFKVAKRAARTGRNPRTGESVQIPAKSVPRFTPGKAFKKTMQ